MTKEALIPKTIHYCWLSGEKMPADAVKCIDSWKRHMPEYTLVLWDMNKFDIDSHRFVKEACSAKKWAFASDYIRLYALYTEGGIYLDTDVFVKKSFNDFLGNDFFSGIEYHENRVKNGKHLLNKDGTLKNKNNDDIFAHGIQIQAAIIGSVKGHPFIKSCLDWYGDKHFDPDIWTRFEKFVSPCIYAHIATEYGFRYKNEFQKLNCGMTVYPNTFFAGNRTQSVKETYAVHRCDGSWRRTRYKILRKLRNNRFLRIIFGKKKLER
ncbi:MAG: hypothetical protein LBB74_03225 [Chitinispirillales bacterium]|jgi:mannosyltransferase OCH1-like enzyme|nr:hypothetical protein [Chitinispirillales bacterium]